MELSKWQIEVAVIGFGVLGIRGSSEVKKVK